MKTKMKHRYNKCPRTPVVSGVNAVWVGRICLLCKATLSDILAI